MEDGPSHCPEPRHQHRRMATSGPFVLSLLGLFRHGHSISLYLFSQLIQQEKEALDTVSPAQDNMFFLTTQAAAARIGGRTLQEVPDS